MIGNCYNVVISHLSSIEKWSRDEKKILCVNADGFK